MNDYQVRTDIYNGPMDLLLYLIRRDEIDIYDIPLAQVTQTYCEYVALLQTIDPNIAGDFLVMAATLMEMKSRMLLPRQVTEEGEPEDLSDPRLELVRQLLEYKKFKDASFELGNSAYEQSMKWPRIPVKIKVQDAGEVDLDDVQIWDLVGAFNKLMSSIGARRSTHDVVFDDTPISLHAADVVDRLVGEGGRMRFESVFDGRSKVEMIGLFLALLELMRQHRVRVTQRESFDSINIELLSTEPIQVGEDVDSVLSEAVEASEPETIEPELTEPIEQAAEADVAEEPEATSDGEADQTDDSRGERVPGERRAPRKHWKEPIAAFDIEKDELFAELEQIKTNFDIDAIIKESKQRGRRKTEEDQQDAAAEDVNATTASEASADVDANAPVADENADCADASDTEASAIDAGDNEIPADSAAEESTAADQPGDHAEHEIEDMADSSDMSASPAELAQSAEPAVPDNTTAAEAPADESVDEGRIIAEGTASIEMTNTDEPTLQPNTESDPS